jgi:hypothetical protein
MSDDVDDIATKAVERTFPWTIKLKHPVKFGEGETVTELTMQRGKLGHLKGIKLGGDEMSMDHILLVAARMSGQPTKVIEGLDPEDAEEVIALVINFFAKCLGGGRTR